MQMHRESGWFFAAVLNLRPCLQDAIQGTIIAGNDTTSTGMITLLGMWPKLPQRVKDKVQHPTVRLRSTTKAPAELMLKYYAL